MSGESCLKDFLSGALVALLFGRLESGIWHYGEHSCGIIFEFGPVVQEWMSFKAKVDGWTPGTGQKEITIAFSSDELK